MKLKVFVGVLIIIVLSWGFYLGVTSSYSAQASRLSNPDPTGMPHLLHITPTSLGMSAIHVIKARNVEQKIPLISRADVEAYIKIHSFIGGSAVAGATPKVIGIDYIASKVASLRMGGEPTGLADNAMVYYVEWQGPFDLTMINPPPGARVLKPASSGVEIFDAQTGNMLLWWAPNN